MRAANCIILLVAIVALIQPLWSKPLTIAGIPDQISASSGNNRQNANINQEQNNQEIPRVYILLGSSDGIQIGTSSSQSPDQETTSASEAPSTSEEPAITSEEPAITSEEPAITSEEPAITTEQPQ